MQSAFRYVLQPYLGMSTRHKCPLCKHRNKTFTLYIDTQTGEPLHADVGRCSRQNNCGYHYAPKQYFADNSLWLDKRPDKLYLPKRCVPVPKPASFIPLNKFRASLQGYGQNCFVSFISNLFGPSIVNRLIAQYFIGTSKHWSGATVFWQISRNGNVCSGKIMLYNAATGKRVKQPFNHINWVHKALQLPQFNLKQCFFGEHLLTDTFKPVAIVESEKTAIIASVYMPGFIWLAAGSLNNLNAERCKVLTGRNVYLFPDLNCFEQWATKAAQLAHLANFTISDLLERKATPAEKTKGLDLADYLMCK